MKVRYDKYYKTENLFGNAYPELIDFFKKFKEKGNLLDLGCGQGRDAIPLARLGFTVTGIDNSKVGIDQMNRIAKTESLPLNGKVSDIYTFDDFGEYDFVLLDSMFHFEKKDRTKEREFILRILSKIKKGCILVFCIQDSGKKVDILNKTMAVEKQLERIIDKKFKYLYEDKESEHKSESDYRLIAVKKIRKYKHINKLES